MSGRVLVLPLDNDFIVQIVAKDDAGAAATGLTVTVTITDTSDVEVTGATWPITASEDASGTYKATIPEAVNTIDETFYYVVVDNDANNQTQKQPAKALVRTGIEPSQTVLRKQAQQAGVIL